MKIAVHVTIEMTDDQIEALAHEYGLGDGEKVSAAGVRDFVKGYVQEYAQQSPAGEFWIATIR